MGIDEVHPYVYEPKVLTSFPDGSVRTCSLDTERRLRTLLVDHHAIPKRLRTYSSAVFVDTLKLIQPASKRILCSDATRSLTVDNAGGQSEYSEAISMNYFHTVLKASDMILEMEVEYWIDYKMVDYICSVSGERIGVSVARGMGFPTHLDFTDKHALALLRKKLFGLIVSRNSVVDKHSFYKSCVHILCQSQHVADTLQRVYASLDINDFGLNVKCDLVLLLTVCDSQEVYTNKW